MNILLVTGAFPIRSETFIYRKAVALAERGHRVTVTSREPGDWSLYPDPLPPTMTAEVLRPSRALAAPAGLARLYARCAGDPRTKGQARRYFFRHLPLLGRTADVVHFEFLSLGAMFPLARAVVGAPVVVSCRGADVNLLQQRAEARKSVLLQTLADADVLHCVSTEIALEVERVSGRRDDLVINRPAVDTDAITPPVGRARREGPCRIIACGRLLWKKGFDYLLAAIERVVARGTDVHVSIIGEGELEKSLRFAIGDLGLDGSVELVGGITSREVLARMQEADLFVLSSLEEGISNAVLEAMASGLPVVSTDAGGMAEAISDGVEGFIVPVRDPVALAARIELLARDPAQRARMGAAARARAEREFSIRRQADVFEQIYQRALATRRAA